MYPPDLPQYYSHPATGKSYSALKEIAGISKVRVLIAWSNSGYALFYPPNLGQATRVIRFIQNLIF